MRWPILLMILGLSMPLMADTSAERYSEMREKQLLRNQPPEFGTYDPIRQQQADREAYEAERRYWDSKSQDYWQGVQERQQADPYTNPYQNTQQHRYNPRR